MGKGKQTIGYHYYFTMLLGLCRGPIDSIVSISVGDKSAWGQRDPRNPSRAAFGQKLSDDIGVIDAPDLHGGEDGEGGVQGVFRLNRGADDQVLPAAAITRSFARKGPRKRATIPPLKSLITGATGGLMGDLRGRATLAYDGLVASLNPYIKTWRFQVARTTSGWYRDDPWYPERCQLLTAGTRIAAMNPAHILYECATNPEWGLGAPVEYIDDAAFRRAADTLRNENFGLCLAWRRQTSIAEFMRSVAEHIGGTIYTDRRTGKITPRLFRDDYDRETLPEFAHDSGLIGVERLEILSGSSAASEIVVNGFDPTLNEKISARAQSLAGARAQNGIASVTLDFPGLPTTQLCARVAERELLAATPGIRRFRVTLDRRGFLIAPGSVFRVSDPKNGLDSTILRAGEISDSAIADGRITVTAVEDVFSLGQTGLAGAGTTLWRAPSDLALAADASLLGEATYRDLYRRRDEATARAARATESFVLALAGSPSQSSRGFYLQLRAEGEPEFVETGRFFFTAQASLASGAGAGDTELRLAEAAEIDDLASLEDGIEGQAVLVDSEIMAVTGYDATTRVLSVTRGAVDTWPAAHEAGARLWALDDDGGADRRAYLEGETVEARIITTTSADRLEEADAAILTATMRGRPARPYPPADVRVDGVSILEERSAGPVQSMVSWSGRNRVTQGDKLIGFLAPPVTPEAGTTWRARVYDSVDAVAPRATHDGIASPWTYAPPAPPFEDADVWIELVAVRDGLESLAPRRFRVRRVEQQGEGWDFNWGRDWGGAPEAGYSRRYGFDWGGG